MMVDGVAQYARNRVWPREVLVLHPLRVSFIHHIEIPLNPGGGVAYLDTNTWTAIHHYFSRKIQVAPKCRGSAPASSRPCQVFSRPNLGAVNEHHMLLSAHDVETHSDSSLGIHTMDLTTSRSSSFTAVSHLSKRSLTWLTR
jgi:hypothetical protein